MSRRLLVNAAAFAVLGGALFVWAIFNLLSFDFVERPIVVTAEFDTSPGLLPAFQASYLGVPVGTIRSVDLVGGKVRVELKLERDEKIPADVRAGVKRRSAVGEPYIDMTLPPGTTFQKGRGPYLKDGDVIPISRTEAPLEYSDLFNALDNLVRTIPEDTLRTFIRELSVGLQGREGSIRQVLAGASDLTATVAANSELFEQLIGETNRLVHTLASHTGEMAVSFDNLVAVTGALRDSRGSLTTLLEKGPGFAEEVAKLLAATGADLGCFIDVLGATATELATPATLADLQRLISRGPEFRDLLRDIVRPRAETAGNPWLHVGIRINGGDPVPAYATQRTLPTPPPIRTCKGAPVPPGLAGAGAAAAAGAPPTPEGTAATKDIDAGSRPPALAPEFPESSRKKVDSGGRPDVGRLALPLLVMVGLVVIRPWRWLPFIWRRGGG